MNRYSFYTLDVFTEQIFGGNPLAVFPQAKGLNAQQMQAIAQELNLSETVFVLPSEQEDCDFKLRIFTPRTELEFAGHPTVGTAYLLAHIGLVKPDLSCVNLEEGVGKVPVSLTWQDTSVVSTALQAAQLPEFSDVSPILDAAKLLNLSAEQLHQELLPAVISCGLPFLYIPLRDRHAVDESALNQTFWQETLQGTDAANVYIFAVEGDRQIYARMFAPGLGIAEDPATGSAATSLAGYLYRYLDSSAGTQTWQIEQGVKMDRPSKLTLTFSASESAVTKIQVGGASVLVSQGEMIVPEL
ncbi:PhzF family phenazine biosynthesis protein [[Limnothrix rosea] IAM M-220]|uniref:PhzF family phenazine biosynthesis protein n=1 Tax=[Limnothrix rosea] IAM M-220 TaxID=454133 RepID=UPI00095D4EBA|nr:PhzF family phenazine biosynthesis protein [[Limnothrix rosea] IAM M-220]OKH18776.1 PhzF family phenazine biosynthesis protein [[Limnothrix rosea] IAM M-220]